MDDSGAIVDVGGGYFPDATSYGYDPYSTPNPVDYGYPPEPYYAMDAGTSVDAGGLQNTEGMIPKSVQDLIAQGGLSALAKGIGGLPGAAVGMLGGAAYRSATGGGGFLDNLFNVKNALTLGGGLAFGGLGAIGGRLLGDLYNYGKASDVYTPGPTFDPSSIYAQNRAAYQQGLDQEAANKPFPQAPGGYMYDLFGANGGGTGISGSVSSFGGDSTFGPSASINRSGGGDGLIDNLYGGTGGSSGGGTFSGDMSAYGGGGIGMQTGTFAPLHASSSLQPQRSLVGMSPGTSIMGAGYGSNLGFGSNSIGPQTAVSLTGWTI